MFKEISLLALLFGCAAAQNPMATMYLMNMLGGGSSGGGGVGGGTAGSSGTGEGGGLFGGLFGGGGSGGTGQTSTAGGIGAFGGTGRGQGRGGGGGAFGFLGRMFNNPMLLCGHTRQTVDVQMLPCRGRMGRMVCNMQSMREYGFPGLMTCSPIGFGCCLGSMQHMMMANMMGAK